jgi:uncharacterized protein (TIGR03067 family)
MRTLALAVLVLGVSLSAAADDDKELKRFQGDWQAVAVKRDGKTTEGDALKGKGWRFDGNKLIPLDDVKDEATITLDPTKKPATVDIKDKNGKVNQGIYKFTGDDKLTVCARSDSTRPKEFDAAKDSGNIVIELERVKKK